MCGITGYIYTDKKTICSSDTIRAMLGIQKHRGPDDSGIRVFSLTGQISKELKGDVTENPGGKFEGVLGFNRLSIQDLSLNGHQPMCSPDEKVFLTFNGEIYNALDYKKELTASGYKFKGTSDTEVILYLYLKYGFEVMIQKLNGMFAIVIADLNLKQLFIARDRFGIKPMYYFFKNSLLAFSSEWKSFLSLKEFEPVLNKDLIDEYLIFRSNLNNTLIKNVQCLEPGTYLTFSEGSGIKIHKFFDAENYRRTNNSDDISKSIENFKHELKESVNRQLISDVKLGCQLSGGIDSSLVTYFAEKIKKDGLLESISITLEDKHFSEEPYIDQVANLIKIKSHKFQLDASYYLKNFNNAVWHFEGPLNHPNTIGIYLLSQQAKKYVTVLLSGEGADEVFGGYSRFAFLKSPYNIKTFFSGAKKNRNSLINYLSNYFRSDYRSVMASAYMTEDLAKKLHPQFNFEKAFTSRKDIYSSLTGSAFDKQVKYEIKTYLPDLLIRQDKMSMAHTIENRVPFLDNKLVDFSFNIPEENLVPSGADQYKTKYILKKAASDIFGESFAFRTKQGFGIPLRKFFKDPEFNSYLHDEIVPGISSRGLFNGTLVKSWVSNLDTLPLNELDALWISVSFEAWAKKYNLQS